MLEEAESSTVFGHGQELTATFTGEDSLALADGRAVTALQWIEGSDARTVGFSSEY